MATAVSPATHRNRPAVERNFEPRGAARDLFFQYGQEVVLSGPAGTGKSRACLERMNRCAHKYPGMRGLIVRKTRTSLTESAMTTFERQVLHPLDRVSFHTSTQEYRYSNGSVIVVGGLDKPTKIMSSEYDVIYLQEATEALEDDWEMMLTRLRNGVVPYQQLMGDCNPDAPSHWLKQRANTGKTVMLESRHEDNPGLFNPNGSLTERGAKYMEILDSLTGVRLKRLRFGIWAAAEGMVYDTWDPAVHVINAVPVPETVNQKALDKNGIPLDWPRVWSVDFGYTHPFVWQAWAIDPDGRVYLYHEIYRTQRLVEDHARDIRFIVSGEPPPIAIICDHDAEDRATLERHLGMRTMPAYKAVSAGIQAVASRLKVAGDGRPRLFLLRAALVERDSRLEEQKRPLRTQEEFESYVWDESANRRKGEEPVKAYDHGMDAMRYLVAAVDGISEGVPDEVVTFDDPVSISPY